MQVVWNENRFVSDIITNINCWRGRHLRNASINAHDKGEV